MSKAWPLVPLSNVLRHRKEFVTIDDLSNYRRPRVQLHAKGIVLRDEVPGALIKTKKQQVCQAGEFLVAEIDAKVGGFGILPDALDGAIVSSHYFLFGVDATKLDRRYLDYFIRTPAFREQVEAQGSTNYAAIRAADVLSYVLPLPPLAEQRRVVARIEELAGKIQEARGVRGASVSEAVGLVSATRNQQVLHLRQRFADVVLADVCTKITDGPHVSPRYVERGVPFISVRNITETEIDFSTAKYITEADHAVYSKKALVERGDVLYTKGGTTGVARRVDDDRPFSIWVHVALLKLRREHADSGYIEHMLNAPTSKEQAELFTRGSSNRDLGLSRMAKITFPLPPLEEQTRIAAYLDQLQAAASVLVQVQQDAAAALDALLPAILDRAFRGVLWDA